MITPELEEFLKQKGDRKIKNINVARRPLKSAVVQKLGPKLVKMPRDEPIWHMATEFELDDGDKFIIGKGTTIHLDRALHEYTDRKPVDIGDRELTLRQYIEKGRIAHERANRPYHKYNLSCSSCQDFTLLHLRGNQLGADVDFVHQRADRIIPKWLQKVEDIRGKIASVS